MTFHIFNSDCIAYLRTVPDNVFDAVVTDPPYELGFMGKKWDSSGVAFDPATWAAVLRVLKPGGHMLAFSGTRTYHRMVCAIEDAGFEIRDQLAWMYGSGFPKSVDKAKVPEGIGTALKPAQEPIVLARKPLIGTVAANVLKHGTGGINIDACRIETSDNLNGGAYSGERRDSDSTHTVTLGRGIGEYVAPAGRWPANVLFDEAAAEALDAQTGIRPSTLTGRADPSVSHDPVSSADKDQNLYGAGASRFFYCAKASRAEREAGLEAAGLPVRSGGALTDRVDGSDGLNSPRAGAGRGGGRRNTHPTVKPVELMRYLVRLITPPGGLVLDPFAGSGTTLVACVAEGMNCVGTELSADYCAIAFARCASRAV